MVRLVAKLACLMMLATSATAQPLAPEIVKDLAPQGRLRAAINFGNPVLAQKDAATGEPRGISVDLARELGRRLGVAVDLIPFDAAGKVADAVRTGTWDIAFLAVDPGRANDIAFTAPYVVIEGTYLVAADSRCARSTRSTGTVSGSSSEARAPTTSISPAPSKTRSWSGRQPPRRSSTCSGPKSSKSPPASGSSSSSSPPAGPTCGSWRAGSWPSNKRWGRHGGETSGLVPCALSWRR